MDIILYAGSLRPGGGLTVAAIMINALAEDPDNKIVVFTGSPDASLYLTRILNRYNNVTEKKFFPSFSSNIRYLFSKLYFIPKSILKRKTLLISVNYFIPSFYKLYVYHLNLLSFMVGDVDSLGMWIKRLDAKLACRYADVNIFESHYLKDTAEEYTGLTAKNSSVLYIGVDSAFYVHSSGTDLTTNIIVVSSMQPHKDNETCIKSLQLLTRLMPDVSWTMTIVGGQSTKQWKPLEGFSKSLDVAEYISFLGPISKEILSRLMSRSLCLISASKVESFCMVALEAMASGCSTIVTDKTSMPESVGDCAIMVSSGNAEEFADEIMHIYKDARFRQELINKGIVRSKLFSNEVFKENFKKIIKE